MTTLSIFIGFLFGLLGNNDDSNLLKQDRYANGQIKMEYVIKNSSVVEANYYYDNGQLREKGQFKGHNMHGTWESFNIEGNMVAKAKYNNGKVIKKTFWNNDGSLAGVITPESTNDQLVLGTD